MKRLPVMLILPGLMALWGCESDEPRLAAGRVAQSSARFGVDSTGAFQSQLVNRRWLSTQTRYWGGPWVRVILLETDSATWVGGEKWLHRISVDGWVDSIDAAALPTWHIESTGDSGGFDGPFYHVVHEGCCDVKNAHEYFSLRTGARLFLSTQELLKVSVSNSPIERYVGYLDTRSVLEPERPLTGVLQYGPPDGPVQQVLLEAISGHDAFYGLVDIQLRPKDSDDGSRELTIWAKVGEHNSYTISGFSIWLKLLTHYDGPLVEVLVPVEMDSLDVSCAVFPAGLKVEYQRKDGAT